MERDDAEPTTDLELLAERVERALLQVEINSSASEQARNLLRQATARFMDEQSRVFGEFREEMSAAVDAFREEQIQKLDDLRNELRGS